MSETIQLSIKTLEWAARKINKNLHELASQLYSKQSEIENIVEGRLKMHQIKKFSERTKVPYGFFFLPSPPQEYNPNPRLVDFRTKDRKKNLSRNFIDVCEDIEHKQLWYRDYLISIDAPKLDFVGKYKEKEETPATISSDIRRTLGIDKPVKFKNADDYYKHIVKLCEDNGILVFKNSIVINSTRRKLDIEEFRGFVLIDEYAPAIFINGNDATHANIFTLAHELAHIWLGESVILDIDVKNQSAMESKCNAIAAAILVPDEDFASCWDSENDDCQSKISRLNQVFKVSELVLARIALTHKKISQAEYQRWYLNALQRKIRTKKGGAVSPKIIIPIRNSRLITRTITELLNNNQIQPREAAILLNMKVARVMSL